MIIDHWFVFSILKKKKGNYTEVCITKLVHNNQHLLFRWTLTAFTSSLEVLTHPNPEDLSPQFSEALRGTHPDLHCTPHTHPTLKGSLRSGPHLVHRNLRENKPHTQKPCFAAKADRFSPFKFSRHELYINLFYLLNSSSIGDHKSLIIFLWGRTFSIPFMKVGDTEAD